MAQALDHLQQNDLVHGDLNPSNICINFSKDDNSIIESLKLIDFGSSFEYDEIMNISQQNPEYLSNEVLIYHESIQNMVPERRCRYT
jgi:serine/threonine protein kinase